jgi:hypothetical protein
MAESRSERAARLLLDALDRLPDRDRTLVLTELLSRDMGPVEGRSGSLFREIPQSSGSWHETLRSSGQVDQPLLVRLPADLHGRFRRWSVAHGFSMAAVVRGLVERFLDQQEGTSGSRTGRSRP